MAWVAEVDSEQTDWRHSADCTVWSCLWSSESSYYEDIWNDAYHHAETTGHEVRVDATESQIIVPTQIDTLKIG